MSSFAAGPRLVAWLALGCHVLVASGLPLPLAAPLGGAASSRIAGKDHSRPFPCMDKPCGCATAEQCFASCCCHTPAQRLAWARAHRVEEAVLAALERRVAAAKRPATGCCATDARPRSSCCPVDAPAAVDPEAPEVCGEYRSLAADPADAEPAAALGPGIVILRDALACGGILSAWLACGAAVPPPPRAAPPDPGAATGSLVFGDDVAPSVSADRSVPPPRVA